ncbi:MAG TPA: hypothetical protein VGE07_31430 [Herpetosiphonaceae bacterium]
MPMITLYRLGMRLLPRIPERLIYALCGLGAWLALLAAPAARRGALHNLARTQPGLGAWRRLLLARRTIAYVFRHYADLLRLPTFGPDELARRFEITGAEHIDALLAAGNGGMMAVPHCGSFSTILAALAARGYPLVLVVERIEPPEMLELVSALRRRPNLEVLPLGPSAGRDVLRAMRANKIVVLAGDRDLASQNLRLPFFGEETSVPVGIARLAARGAPVITAFAAWVDGAPSVARIEPLPDAAALPGEAAEAAVARITGLILERFETYIRAFPASWGVLQPNWPTTDEV